MNLLRARAVTVRRAAPTLAQIAIATREYEAGKAIAPLAADLGLTYGALRRALMLPGVQMRPRGFQEKE